MTPDEQAIHAMITRYHQSVDGLDEIAFWPLSSDIIGWIPQTFRDANLEIIERGTKQFSLNHVFALSIATLVSGFLFGLLIGILL